MERTRLAEVRVFGSRQNPVVRVRLAAGLLAAVALAACAGMQSAETPVERPWEDAPVPGSGAADETDGRALPVAPEVALEPFERSRPIEPLPED